MAFKNIPLKIKGNSGFSQPFHSALTQNVGSLVPLFIDDVIPTQKTKISMSMVLKLPPMAFDTFMRVYYKVEAFFVPKRLLCGSYESFFNDKSERVADFTTGSTISDLNGLEPCMSIASPNFYSDSVKNAMQQFLTSNFGPGTLADYLGLNQPLSYFDQRPNQAVDVPTVLNIMPFLAYHRIYSDWYRNSQISHPAFIRKDYAASSSINFFCRCAPYQFFDSRNYIQDLFNVTTGAAYQQAFQCADGHSIFALRQRNWNFDMFTTALPTATQINPIKIEITPASPGMDYFTIPSLRAGNSLQMLKDRSDLVGNQYVDNLDIRYGAKLSDGLAQRSMLLGSASYPIFTSGVLQNSNAAGPAGTNNPFVSVGAQYGRAYAEGSNFNVEFTAQEPGFLFILGSVVPDSTYTYHMNQIFKRYVGAGSITDMPHPYLELVGPEPIYSEELTYGPHDQNYIFGYQDRFHDFKDRINQVHGLFRAGQSLDSAVAQRPYYSSTPSITSNFLSIPTTALDNVTAVTADLSNYGAMVDLYFNFFKTLPLSEYCIPTLADPATEHGRTIYINRGGKQIR